MVLHVFAGRCEFRPAQSVYNAYDTPKIAKSVLEFSIEVPLCIKQRRNGQIRSIMIHEYQTMKPGLRVRTKSCCISDPDIGYYEEEYYFLRRGAV
jgi:hypothetical protein